jgi:hypothetical protein
MPIQTPNARPFELQRPLGPALAGRRRLLRRAGGAGDDVHGEQLLCGGGGVAGGVPGQDGERAPVVCHH